MNKTTLKISAIAAFIMACGFNASAQETATATATATIVTPIAIVNAGNMNFGNVAVQSSTGGTVIMSTGGVRSTGGLGGVTLPANNGTVSAAHFTVSGQPGYTYAITLPVSDLTISSGANTMLVGTFTSDPLVGAGLLSGSGSQTVNIGATLNVSAAQPAGTYANATGFDVTVNYN